MAVAWGGSRLALRRPPNWAAGPFGPVIRYVLTAIIMACVMLTTGALIWPMRAPAGTPYVTITVTSILAVLFGRSAAPVFPWRVVVYAAWAVAAGAWLFEASWETYTTAAVATVIMLFALVRPGFSFWEASVLLALCSAWDAWNLFAAHAAAAASAASADPFAPGGILHGPIAGIPEFIGIAGHLAPVSTYVTGLGIGDVALPGLLIVAAGRAGKLAGTPWLYRAAMGAYAAALAAVMVISHVTGASMPALPFATVAVVPAVALTAWRTGAWRSLSAQHLPVPAGRAMVPKAAEAGADA
ncbi:MAG TPA: hypothetical protein VGG25_17325 [Streptosporangiaceae bacterium]|jgi:hypothetical protein